MHVLVKYNDKAYVGILDFNMPEPKTEAVKNIGIGLSKRGDQVYLNLGEPRTVTSLDYRVDETFHPNHQPLQNHRPHCRHHHRRHFPKAG